MQQTALEIGNQVRFTETIDEKFRSNYLCIRFRTSRNAENAPVHALLTDVLTESSADYPSRGDMALKLDSLYAADFSGRLCLIGNTAELVFTGEDGTEIRKTIQMMKGPGILQGIHNMDKSIESFARCCFNYALDQKISVWLGTKDTISKTYDGNFKAIFQRVYDEEYKAKFEAAGIEYFYTLIDDAVARVMRSEGGFMWAPDCAYKNGKYYFYFPHPTDTDWNNSWKVGIAVSDSPASGFKCLGYLEGLGNSFSMIDPCVFIDEDGTPYFYYGGGGRIIGVKLKENMTEIDGTVQTMTGLKDYHEGPWIFKNKGLYYLMYADNHQEPGKGGRNQLRYATSNNPLGPWEYRGIILKPTDCDTSHGSIVKYKGNWFLFYHNCSISHNGCLRSICVDRLFFNEDGTIQEVQQTLK